VRLGSPRLEGELRRLARAEADASPAARKVYHQNRRRKMVRGEVPWWLVGAVATVAAFAASAKPTSHWTLLALTVLATGWTARRAMDLSWRIQGTDDVALPLVSLPISDADYARLQTDRWLKGSWVSLAFMAVCFAGLAWGMSDAGPGIKACALAAAALQCGVISSFGALLSRIRWGWWMGIASMLVMGAGPLMLWAGPPRGYSGAAGLAFFEPLLPTAWVTAGFRMLALEGDLRGALLAIPAALLAAALPLFLARKRREPRYWELTIPAGGTAGVEHAVDQEIAQEPNPPPPKEMAALRHRVRAELTSNLEDRIRTRKFLGEPEWRTSGFLERVAAALMSDRERILADFLMAGPTGWGRAWVWAALWSAAAALVGFYIGSAQGANFGKLIFPGVLGALAAWHAGALVGGQWPGFGLIRSGSLVSPVTAGYPIGYFEAARVALKVHAVRCLAWLPLGALAIAGLVRCLGGAWTDLPLYTARAGAILILAQPAVIAICLAAGNRDVSRWQWRSSGHALAAVAGIVVSLGCTACLFLPPTASLWPVWLAGLAAACWGALGLGRLNHVSRHTDWIRPFRSGDLT